jgi:uncharacterized protein
MNKHRPVIDAYMDGFRTSNHAQILACLTEDVVWEIHGYKTLSGKAEFDQEIENPAFSGSPTLTEESYLELGALAVFVGEGSGNLTAGGVFRFRFATTFMMKDDLIAKVESFVEPITESSTPT